MLESWQLFAYLSTGLIIFCIIIRKLFLIDLFQPCQLLAINNSETSAIEGVCSNLRKTPKRLQLNFKADLSLKTIRTTQILKLQTIRARQAIFKSGNSKVSFYQ